MPLIRPASVSANESIKKEHKLLGLDHLREFAVVYIYFCTITSFLDTLITKVKSASLAGRALTCFSF